MTRLALPARGVRTGGKPAAAPRVLFLGCAYAGHRTRFANLRARAEQDSRIDSSFHAIEGWREGGRIERLPLLPQGLRGRMRSLLEAAPLAGWPRPDIIWTSATEILTPYLWTQAGPLRRPLVLDIDCTDEQLEVMAVHYFGRPPKRGLRRQQALAIQRLLWSRVDLFTPWSNWAAEGLLSRGIDPNRVHVLPPGLNLEQWQLVRRSSRAADEKLRLLFVGGDFQRKGGDMLLELVGGPLRDRVELDVVTRDPVAATPGVRVHRAEANSPELLALYAAADLFVLPTRAECFGIATIEAMATGLPVIVGDVGGARDIVDHGHNGWLISPEIACLREALEHALCVREHLPEIGEAGRRKVERDFDGAQNAPRIIDLLLEQWERRRAPRRRQQLG